MLQSTVSHLQDTTLALPPWKENCSLMLWISEVCQVRAQLAPGLKFGALIILFIPSTHPVYFIYAQRVLPLCSQLSHRSRASPWLSVTFCLQWLFPFAFKNVPTSAIPSSPSPALFLTADEPITPLVKHPGHAVWPSSPWSLLAISATLAGQQVPEINLSLPPNAGVTACANKPGFSLKFKFKFRSSSFNRRHFIPWAISPKPRASSQWSMINLLWV